MPNKPKEIHPIDLEVARRVRKTRIDCGIAQATVSKIIGVSATQIQKYETGQNRLSISRLCEIAQVFGVHPSHLFPSPSGDFLTQELNQMWQKLRNSRVEHLEISVGNHHNRQIEVQALQRIHGDGLKVTANISTHGLSVWAALNALSAKAESLMRGFG